MTRATGRAALDALRDLSAVPALLHRRPALPPASACERQAALTSTTAAAGLPDPRTLETLRIELRDACAVGGATALPMRSLRRAPMVFWDREPQAAGFPGLLEAVLVGAAQRPRWLREVIEAWFRDFGLDRLHLPKTGMAVATMLRQAGDPRLVLWQQAHRRYALFDASDGPQRLAAALLQGTHPVSEALTQSGMDDPLRAEGRYFRAVAVALLRSLPLVLRGPAAEAAWQRAALVLEGRRQQADRQGRVTETGGLRFPDQAGAVIAACLEPWLRGPAPGVGLREAVKAFLLRTVGDPRLHPERWLSAPEDCTRLMRGWLASASLETFFDLISETNDDPQWRYRRAFWRACLRKMPDTRPAEVWVVLGPGMASRARTVRDLAGAYGRMEASGNNGDQAVLLLRLGNLVLSEWSNVGPVRAWQVGGRHCPALYAQQYGGNSLRARSLDFPDHPHFHSGGSVDGKGLYHRGPERGLWQGCAAAFLRDQLQLVLSPEDYMRL